MSYEDRDLIVEALEHVYYYTRAGHPYPSFSSRSSAEGGCGCRAAHCVGLGDSLIGCVRSGIHLSRTFHGECLVRAFVVELGEEGIELSLLLQEVLTSWSRGFLFEGQVHALMPAVLLWMTA